LERYRIPLYVVAYWYSAVKGLKGENAKIEHSLEGIHDCFFGEIQDFSAKIRGFGKLTTGELSANGSAALPFPDL
jgi:hypothetical protein